jgi:phosphoribosylaminoimidazole carboxylase PurE protein
MKTRTTQKRRAAPKVRTPRVAVVMGSQSDLPTMKAAAEVLKDFGIPHSVKVLSAHRTPEEVFNFARDAFADGFRVIVAGAGGAAHLPGMIAALTPLPVIGVPILSASLQAGGVQGLDALLSIVQMPKGVPVATVAIGGAYNAGLLAVQMLAAGEQTGELIQRVAGHKGDLRKKVLSQARKPSARSR